MSHPAEEKFRNRNIPSKFTSDEQKVINQPEAWWINSAWWVIHSGVERIVKTSLIKVKKPVVNVWWPPVINNTIYLAWNPIWWYISKCSHPHKVSDDFQRFAHFQVYGCRSTQPTSPKLFNKDGNTTRKSKCWQTPPLFNHLFERWGYSITTGISHIPLWL